MTRTELTPDTVTLHVPFRITKRGGRKEMVLPATALIQRTRIDSTLVKALARAFRWKRMLDTGEYSTIAELAEKEQIASSYLTRVMRLTQLAPELVEAILDGRQPSGLSLEVLGHPLPDCWRDQVKLLGSNAGSWR